MNTSSIPPSGIPPDQSRGENSADTPSLLRRLRESTPQPSPEEFLIFFPGAFIQYFDDSNKKDAAKGLSTPTFDSAFAKQKQADGCGVFFCPNPCTSKRRISNLAALRAVIADIDCGKEGDHVTEPEMETRKNATLDDLLSTTLRPHVVIETKNGLQAIWLINPMEMNEEALTRFREAEETIIGRFKADGGAKDPTRVLRLPGFLHQKDPKHPFLCRLLINRLKEKPYQLNAFVTEFGAVKETGKSSGKITAKRKSVPKSVKKGGRNNAATSMAGIIITKLDPAEWDTIGWKKLCEWNRKECQPPLGETELRSVFESIKKKRTRDGSDTAQSAAQAAVLVTLAEESGDVFLHDQYGHAYVAVKRGKSHIVFAIEDSAYKSILAKRLWDAKGKVPNGHAVDGAVSVLAGKAVHEGKKIELRNRVAKEGDVLWYDLSDNEGRAVRITKEGYVVVDDPPILFQRYSHQLPQVPPSPPDQADASLLLQFVTLSKPEQHHLLLVWLAVCFIPDIPHPIINFYGAQGSSKTVLARMLKMIIDPSLLETISPSVNTYDLIQKLSHHWFLFFDNLQKIPVWISDELCRAVTGGGFLKRKLYTDNEDVMYSFIRCVGLNGINLVATRPDLLDRSILFRFDRIEDKKRRSEREIWQTFNALKPRILGGIFLALSKAMNMQPIVLAERPRMADFAEEGCRVAEGLNIPHQQFLDAYKANRAIQHEAAIHEDSVGIVVMEYMNEHHTLEGTPSYVFKTLTQAADEMEINMYGKGWPGSPQSFTRRLNELATNLHEMGIRISTNGKKDDKRWTIIEWSTPEGESS